MVDSAEIVSFSFPKFVPGQPSLLLQRDAVITSTGRLQPTKVDAGKPVRGSVGRALYSAPIHIWDSNTGNTANFVTSFSFVITAPTSTPADGIAFFLAPVNSQPPTTGGLLGLFPKEDSSASYKTVAVEFDTFRNQGWDPAAPHIGIDVNSIQSTKTTPWALESGKVANVTISFEASTGTLTASLVYPSSAASYIVSGTVDLKDVLDEYVSVGLSASTGEYSEINEVLSWSFKSELP